MISKGFFSVRSFSKNRASRYSSESSSDSFSDEKYFEIAEYSIVDSSCFIDFTFVISRVLAAGPPDDKMINII